jgi:hypothetical protein
MYTKVFNTIDEFGENFKKGSFGLYCATYTPKKVNKTPKGETLKESKQNKTYAKYDGRVFTLALYENACSGVSYYACVKSECKREGIDFTDEEFNIAFPKESTYAKKASDKLENFLLKKKDGEQRYLRLYQGRKPTKVKYFTFLDDRLATEEEEKDILKYITPKKASAKQEALNIKNIIGVKNFKEENVIFLAQGEKAWANERFGNFGTFEDITKLIHELNK